MLPTRASRENGRNRSQEKVFRQRDQPGRLFTVEFLEEDLWTSA